jgi:hypothetical protein
MSATSTTKVLRLELVLCSSCLWSWSRFASIDSLRRSFSSLDSILMDLYSACVEELYSDVVVILCNSSFIIMLYGFVPLETGIARDSCFLRLSRRCRESGFRSRKFGSFHLVDDKRCTTLGPGNAPSVRLCTFTPPLSDCTLLPC